MVKNADKNVIMQATPTKGVRVFKAAVYVLSFIALFLLLASGVTPTTVRFCSVILGTAVAVVTLVFGDKKYAMLIIAGVLFVYTLLCVVIDINAFVRGCVLLFDGVAEAINLNTHAGLCTSGYAYSAAADYLVWSTLSVWLAFALSAVAKKSELAVIIATSIVLFVMLCAGLYPAVYAVIMLVAADLGLIIVNRGFTLKSAICCFASAVVVLLAVSSGFLYSGSPIISNFRNSIVRAAEDVYYGSDNLPDGNLAEAGGVGNGDKVRLSVTAPTQIEALYLRGFVGSSLVGNVWQETDKNLYVQNGYQGLIDYVVEEGLPITQYAKYSELEGRTHKYTVTVNNVAAKTKYMYTPYTLSEYSGGSRYYDLNLRDGERSYTFEVFAGDESGERASQASWLFSDLGHTREMAQYVAVENEYRSFVYDAYGSIDDGIRQAVQTQFDGIEATSINTVAQVVRAYFLDKFTLGEPDAIKSDFTAEFFGGDIKTANSPYFATAATYIFRSYGYAARYVEGYLFKPDADEEAGTVAVTDKNSHAWTEVYFDGIGWLPIEVTPTFFSEELPDVLVDPDDPDAVNTQVSPSSPETPSDENEPPEPIDTTTNPYERNDDDPYAALLIALKVLLPITTVLLVIMLTVLAVVARRMLVLENRRKSLDSAGAKFGRVAYGIIEKDCTRFGGFSAETLEKYGIERATTDRFIQLIEKSVYGDYDLNINERNVVTHYINTVAAAITESGGVVNKFLCKYIMCLGI